MIPSLPTKGRLAGIDYGTKRIGVAVCDPGQRLASPHVNYTRQDKQAEERFFKKLAEEEQLAGFVVGLPVHGSGDESQKSYEARQFGAWLAKLTGLPVAYYDERYTSVMAESLLAPAGFTKKRRKQRLDAIAAQVILAAYLESERGGEAPGALD